MAIEIQARKREAQGTGASRRLRRMGRVPGIVYGGDRDAVRIELDHKDLFLNLRNERFHASILALDVEGTKEQVLLRAVNMHPFKMQVQHVDFQRVSKDRKIHMKVPLHFVNAEVSAGVKEQGGVVNHVMNELKMPKGVEPALHKGENPVVATIVIPKLVTEDEEAAPAVAAADVPTTEQAAPAKEGEAAAEGAKAGDKGAAAKGGDKAAADKGDKKDKK